MVKQLSSYSVQLVTESPQCEDFCRISNGVETCGGTTQSGTHLYNYAPTITKLTQGPDYIYFIGSKDSSLFAIDENSPSKNLSTVGAVEYCRQFGTTCPDIFGTSARSCPSSFC